MVVAVLRPGVHAVRQGRVERRGAVTARPNEGAASDEDDRVPTIVHLVLPAATSVTTRHVLYFDAAVVQNGARSDHVGKRNQAWMSKTSGGARRQSPTMATIRKEILIDVDCAEAWDAVRDFGALHRRLAPGFAVDTRIEGDDRIVTFAWGDVMRERFIACDDERRRLVWSIVDGPYRHHNGSAEVAPAPSAGTMFTWTTDLLPDELAQHTERLMDEGIEVIRKTLGGERT